MDHRDVMTEADQTSRESLDSDTVTTEVVGRVERGQEAEAKRFHSGSSIAPTESGSKPHIVILGGGPAGVGGAFQLRRADRAHVTLIERSDHVGGNAGSFFESGQWLDYGSHRLHSASDPEVLADIESLLGDDLADRPRNGRIRLRGRWIRFPLQAIDLVLRLDKTFAAGATADMMLRALPSSNGVPADSFASELEKSLGPTICEHFYFPYARKIWGVSPDRLSAIQAKRRVSAGTFQKLIKKVVKPPGSGRFYYPRQGFGQISRAYADAAKKAGADLRLGTTVKKLIRGKKWEVVVARNGVEERLEADQVWSTIPLTIAAEMIEPGPPREVMEATTAIRYRAMLLVYLELDVDRFTPTDAHYFPEENVAMTRLSEPKNYFGHSEPKGRTTLCAEIPCDPSELLWSMSDEELGRHVVEDIRRAGLELPRAPVRTFSRRLPQAYPIYLRGYDEPFQRLDRWLSGIDGFLSYGRQGLFAHDNTHHALFMAYSAVSCLDERGRFDRDRWAECRKIFESHVVED
jgi:protoporphyrinogen oxidase